MKEKATDVDNWLGSCVSATPAPAAKTTDAAKTTGNNSQFLPPLKDNAAAKTRVLQAVQPAGPTVEHDEWDWWVNQNAAMTVTVNANANCLKSELLHSLVRDWVFANEKPSFTLYDGMYAVLDALYKQMATAEGQKKWALFYVTAKKPDDKPKPADNKKPDAGPIIENGFL